MKRHALALLVLFNLALALALAWMWLHKDASLRNVHWTAPQPLTSNYLQMLPALPTPRSPTGRSRMRWPITKASSLRKKSQRAN